MAQTGSDLIYNLEIIDKETKDRWAVNYLRHVMSDYDNILDGLYRRVGRDKAYPFVFIAIMNKIKEEYPELADTVDFQNEITKKNAGIIKG